MHKHFLFLLPLCLALTAPCAVRADEDGDAMDPEHLPPGYVMSTDAMLGQKPTADMLAIAGEYALKNNMVDKAILYERLALQEDPNDPDVHIAYAVCLTTKLRRQSAEKKDPALFMAAVREWLLIGRSEVGEEKGLTNKKGVAPPGVAKRFQDEERAMMAWNNIQHIVGFLPKARESDKMYLARVQKAVETKVSGQVISDKKTGSDAAPNKDSKQSSQSDQKAAAVPTLPKAVGAAVPGTL